MSCGPRDTAFTGKWKTKSNNLIHSNCSNVFIVQSHCPEVKAVHKIKSAGLRSRSPSSQRLYANQILASTTEWLPPSPVIAQWYLLKRHYSEFNATSGLDSGSLCLTAAAIKKTIILPINTYPFLSEPVHLNHKKCFMSWIRLELRR